MVSTCPVQWVTLCNNLGPESPWGDVVPLIVHALETYWSEGAGVRGAGVRR